MKLGHVVLGLCLTVTSALRASPEGMQVVSGTAQISHSGNHELTIHSGDKTILQWDHFSIGEGERVIFNQADIHSAVLNRVVGNESSQLLGQLLSNGSLFVINPNGVLIGPNARIEAASFLASTLDVLNEAFLSENAMLFLGESKQAVVHLGVIDCPLGRVTLLGNVVKNEGEIHGKEVAIGTSSQLLFQVEGEGGMIRPQLTSEELVEKLQSTANPYEAAIQQKGIISAEFVEIIADSGVTEIGGEIVGEKVHLLGERVLVEDSCIDVSGAKAGEILIGGDYQGDNPAIPNSKMIYVNEGTHLRADSLSGENGGKVVLWSDESTKFYGSILARGGANGGDGGFVEVSGGFLDFQGKVDTSAPLGKAGVLLLDPANITINTTADSGGSFTGGVWTSTASSAVITVSTIETQLASNNVIINTSTTSTPFSSDGTLTLAASSPISWSSANDLSLISDSAMTISSSITCSSSGGINLTCTGNSGGSYTGILISDALSCSSGNIVIEGVAGPGGGNGVQIGASITSTSGAITFQNCVGGGSGTINSGVRAISGTISAPTITATGIQGGEGDATSNNIGFWLNGSTIGDSASNQTISISASGGAGASATSSNYGIYMSLGTLQTGNGGSITLNGRGGGNSANAGSGNYGILIDGVTITLGSGTGFAGTLSLTGVGGNGSGGSNIGVYSLGGTYNWNGNGTVIYQDCIGGNGGANNFGARIGNSWAPAGSSGTLLFDNLTGGTGTTNHYGLYLSGGTQSAATITGTAIEGGSGTSNCIGILIAGGTIGTTSVDHTISFTATGGSGIDSTGTNYGIYLNSGALQTGNNGSITLTGIGGGNVDAAASSNFGIYFNGGTVNLGTGTSFAGTMSLSGTGGTGTSGAHYGVYLNSTTTFNINGNGTFQVINSLGGSGGNSNYGLRYRSTIAPAGSSATVLFSNITGGSPGSGNVGVYLDTGVINASTVRMEAIKGGAGTSQNRGIYHIATAITGDTIDISATGSQAPGTVSTNEGMTILTNASYTINSGGSLTIYARGGGDQDEAGGNAGLGISGGTYTTGAGATVTLTGIAGRGTGSFVHGVYVTSGTFNATGGDETYIFKTCRGGLGGGSSTGVYFNRTLQLTGANSQILFDDIQGGGSEGTGGSNNRGLYIDSSGTIDATTIALRNIKGGYGTSASTGLYLIGTLGNAAAVRTISVDAAGGPSATGGSCYGIQVNGGTIATGDGGSITLYGTGGGNGLNTGSANSGIVLGAGTLSGGSGSTITLTGLGGQGTSGTNRGLDVDSAFTISHAGSGAFTIMGCKGGSGGSGNIGTIFGGSFSRTAGAITIDDVTAGDGSFSHGFYVPSTGLLSAPTISISNVAGGPGASTCIGCLVEGTIGSNSADQAITIQATGGMGPSSVDTHRGIDISGGTITTGNAGSIVLDGTGGGNSANAGSGNVGVYFDTGSLTIGTTTTSTATLSISGRGGAGSGGLHHGAAIFGTATVTHNGNGAITFSNCIAGSGGGGNRGIFLEQSIIPTGSSSSISLTNILGGSGGDDNVGLYVNSGGVLSAPTLTGISIIGGAGSAGNHGILVNGTGLIGSSLVANTISLTALSNGSGIGNNGILVTNSNSSSGIQTVGSGTITLTGTGGPGSSVNSGINISGASALVSSENGAISLVGTQGSGGSSYGITFSSGATVTATGSGSLSLSAGAGSTIGLDASTLSSGTGNITCTGGVTLLGSTPSVTTGGSGDITFVDTIDGAFAISTSAGGTLTFGGAVGSTTPPTGFTTVAGDFSLGGSITLANANLAMATPVVLTNSITTSTTGGSVNFGSTINGTTSGLERLTVASGGGTITLGGVVGGTTPLEGLVVGGGATSFGDNITVSNGSITFSSASTLTGTPTLNAGTGAITFSSTLDATTSGVEGITINSSGGSATFSGAVGGTTRLGTTTITSIDDLTFSDALTTTAVVQSAGTGTTTFAGSVNTSTASGINLTGQDFVFNGAVTTTSSGVVTIANAGTLTIGAAADMSLDGAFSQTGAGSTVSAGNITTSGDNISFATQLTLSGNSVYTTGGTVAGNVTFSSAIDGAGSLTVTGNSIDFTTAFGESEALGSLSATAAGITLRADGRTSGAMTFVGPVTTTTGITLTNTTSGGISLSSTLDLADDITISAPSTSVTVNGNVTATGSSAGVNGYNVIVNAGGAITFAGDIDATGGAISSGVGPSGGNVTLTSTGGNVSVAAIDVSGTNGTSLGGNSGAITLRPSVNVTSGALGDIPDGRIILNGNLTALGGSGTTEGQNGNFYLSATGRSQVPSIATIVSSYAGNDVTIHGGLLVVGPNESITILGDFTADLSSEIICSDIVALDSITLTTPTLVFQQHIDEVALEYTGSLGLITREHIVSRSVTATITTFVGNIDNVGTTSLSQSALQTRLQYTPNSYLLDYDTTITPITPVNPTPTPTPSKTRAQIITEMLVASAQLSDELKWLEEEIRDKRYFLEKKCVPEKKGCVYRQSLEYRPY